MKATPLPDDRDIVTTVEAAALLGLAVRSVQLMVDRGELEGWKTPGGHRRISRASVERALAARQGASAGSAPEAPGPAAPGAGPHRARVLLIEDSVHYQNLIGLLVRRRFPDVELRIASDGVTGLAMFGRYEPDVLLVDILLPGIDGAAMISTLRSSPQFGSSEFIVVTSLDDEQRAPFEYALDGLAVVRKDMVASVLPDLLAGALARVAARGSAAP